MESAGALARHDSAGVGLSLRSQIIVIAVAALVFLGCMISPPSLMDDVDAVQAQIAQNMLESGDWVTARLNGVAYLEKAPLKYWMIAASFWLFGVHDWAARLPVALSAVVLCWVVARLAAWAFGERAGLYSGLVLATSAGLFLFTRILIPDVILTLTITLALWAMVSWRPWLMWAAIGTGLLLKGLIAAVFPVAITVLYLAVTGQIREWRRLRPFSGVPIVLAIAAPWHVLATIGNPPYFDFTMHSESGSYHGFFWFYFINEHVLRFLNLRYPRDYNTVPRLYFWLFHLLWLFPWSFYLPAAVRLNYRGTDKASRVRMLALCWCGVVLGFFTFSTTQEYYSMPCYPALALLLGSAIASGHRWLRHGTRALAVVAAAAAAAIAVILWMIRGMAAPGDIAAALNQNPEIYTLSLGHMTDLTLRAFAYLKAPLALAGVAFLVGAIGRRTAALAAMMVLFFHAARLALVAFDPYLGSRPLAEALKQTPPGKVILAGQYYTFSSVVFYSGGRRVLLLNGRGNNLEYGSYAPDAPQDVFIGDADLHRLWKGTERCYLVAEGPQMPRLANLLGNSLFHVKQSGGKFLVTNIPTSF